MDETKIKSIEPWIQQHDDFEDFQSIFKTTKLHQGIDDIPLTDNNIAEMGKELWLELMNDNTVEDSILTFQK